MTERVPLSEPMSSRRLLLILGGLCAVGPFAVDTYLAAFPAMERDLGSSASHIQLTITTFLVGLAVGQVIAGPLSDRFGRKPPLVIGMAAFACASALCALAPSTGTLIGLRLAQGLAAGSGVVIARAIVRDLFSDLAAARFFSTLMLAFGLGPVLAPVVGGGLLLVTDWRGVFVFLALLGTVLALAVAFALDETLEPARRHVGGVGRAVSTLKALGSDRGLLVFVIPAALAHAAMMAYIAGSTFVFQESFDLSAQAFAAIFCVNSAGLIVASRIGLRALRRMQVATLLRIGLAANLAAAISLLLVIAFDLGLVGLLLPCFVLVSSLGLITPNSLALGLERHQDNAGGASAVFGLFQYLSGAAAAPLVGVAGASAWPMGVAVAVLSLGAAGMHLVLGRGGGRRIDDETAAQEMKSHAVRAGS